MESSLNDYQQSDVVARHIFQSMMMCCLFQKKEYYFRLRLRIKLDEHGAVVRA